MKIQQAINEYLEGEGRNHGRNPKERYASFDYCYNYFYSFYKNNKLEKLADDRNLQLSCLQLGFYLASWGMMRGSSFLLEKSAKHYEELIKKISCMDRRLWEIDVDEYTDENIDLLLKCKEDIKKALGKDNNPSDTLVTKIMLGVFGNVSAFDQYFKKSFGVNSLNKKALGKIGAFYENNKNELDSLDKIKTLDFVSAQFSENYYTKAKLIDMYGFIEGRKIIRQKS